MTSTEKYLDLKLGIKAMTKELEKLEPAVIAEIEALGEKNLDMGVGTISITSRKSWTYPEYVTEAKDKYKAIEAKAQSNGDATFEEEKGLTFREAKI